MIRPQRTLQKTVSFSGIGIHSGNEVTLSFCPAAENFGIVFQRMDLPGQPLIPASVCHVQDTSRSTMIGVQGASVQTVEHVLAALSAYQIDNVRVELSSGEPPIADGSSQKFVELIEEAKILEQQASQEVAILQEPIYFSQGQTHLIALPSDEFRISYTLHYPQNNLIRSQYYSTSITQEIFKNEIANCRTFALYEEITYLIEKGLIRGGSLENAVVIRGDTVLSKEGLRYPNEMVRHKVLDLVGDLALVGRPFLAHVIAIRAGHAANVAFGDKLVKHFSGERDVYTG